MLARLERAVAQQELVLEQVQQEQEVVQGQVLEQVLEQVEAHLLVVEPRYHVYQY
jgi:hypothetical protein